jgi:hypothetical protein
MDRADVDTQRPDLIVAGIIRDAADRRVRLVVAVEPVVADEVDVTLLALHAVEVRADALGRFTHAWDVPDDTRACLRGWVMCTVLVEPQGARATTTKTVRWQRPSSAELIVGLNALLGTIVVEAASDARSNR